MNSKRAKRARVAAGMMLVLGLAAPAPADWFDDFDGASLNPRWTADAPSGSTAIAFNGPQSRVEITTNTAANIWTSRSGAPILWTDAPNLGSTLSFEFETKATMASNVAKQIAGAMAWNGSSTTTGVRAAQFHEWPNLDEEKASFQVFGTSTPGITGDLDATTMWLKLRWEKGVGSGGADRWSTFYATSDPSGGGGWTPLATDDGTYGFTRLGLFLKSADATPREVHFDYAALSTVAGPPSPLTFAGSVLDLSAFRTPSVPKTFDADSDQVYGTDGFHLFHTDPTPGSQGGEGGRPFAEDATSSLPGYVASIDPLNGATSAGDFGYLVVDDPTTTPGPSPSVLESGVATLDMSGLPVGERKDFFDVLLQSGLPADGFRMGILTDNIAANNMPGGVRVELLRGGSPIGDSGLVPVFAGANTQGDWYFFDVLDALPGDLLRVSITQSTGGGISKTLGGLTFDTLPAAVPEPSALLLLALGVLGLGFTKWRTERWPRSEPVAESCAGQPRKSGSDTAGRWTKNAPAWRPTRPSDASCSASGASWPKPSRS